MFIYKFFAFVVVLEVSNSRDWFNFGAVCECIFHIHNFVLVQRPVSERKGREERRKKK